MKRYRFCFLTFTMVDLGEDLIGVEPAWHASGSFLFDSSEGPVCVVVPGTPSSALSGDYAECSYYLEEIGPDPTSTPPLIYTVRLEVLDEDGRPVNGVNVAGGNIFGSTAQGGILERSMVDDGQFQQHLDATYRVEKSGCIVDQQQVLVDKSGGFATITLRLTCSEPLVRLPGAFSRLLFDGENIWLADSRDNTLIKMAIDGTVLGTFPVGGLPHNMVFDGRNIWVAIGRDSVAKLDLNGQMEGTFDIEMTDVGDIEDHISDLVFDGEGIWVEHYNARATKLALDGTELWTIFLQGARGEALVFAGDRMLRVGGPILGRPTLRAFDLEGTLLQHVVLGENYIWDAAFGGDGIWVVDSCYVTKISLDGGAVLGPFRTSVCGGDRELIFDGEYIWVAERGNGAVSLVSRIALDGQLLDVYPVGITVSDLVFDGESIWVATADDFVWSDVEQSDFPTTISVWKITPD